MFRGYWTMCVHKAMKDETRRLEIEEYRGGGGGKHSERMFLENVLCNETYTGSTTGKKSYAYAFSLQIDLHDKGEPGT
eukprot:767946-Hanusia_phi.AAC.7